jgi:hypothetical protein
MKVGGTDNERCRGKLMEVLMMGNLLPTQWILYEAPVKSKLYGIDSHGHKNMAFGLWR